MDKKKFRIIYDLYNADKDILRKKLIGIILEDYIKETKINRLL